MPKIHSKKAIENGLPADTDMVYGTIVPSAAHSNFNKENSMSAKSAKSVMSASTSAFVAEALESAANQNTQENLMSASVSASAMSAVSAASANTIQNNEENTMNNDFANDAAASMIDDDTTIVIEPEGEFEAGVNYTTKNGSRIIHLDCLGDRHMFFANSKGGTGGFFAMKMNAKKGAMVLGEIHDTHMIKGVLNFICDLQTDVYRGEQEVGLHLKFPYQMLRLVGNKKSVGYVRAMYAGAMKIVGIEKLEDDDTCAGELDVINGKLTVTTIHRYVKGNMEVPFTEAVKQENKSRNVVCKMTAADWLTGGLGFTLKPLFKSKVNRDGTEVTHKEAVNKFFNGYIKVFDAETKEEARTIVTRAVKKTVFRQELGAQYALSRAAAETGEVLTTPEVVKTVEHGEVVETEGEGFIGKMVVACIGMFPIGKAVPCTAEWLRAAKAQGMNVMLAE